MLRATPPCDDGDDDPPSAQTEGPYTRQFARGVDLDAGHGAAPALIVTGHVSTRTAGPSRGALLDFWQADAGGHTTTPGYRLRGHQFADDRGATRWRPSSPASTRPHAPHPRQGAAPAPAVLTTQLYFPGEPRNSTDTIFGSSLLMDIGRVGNGRRARFRFVAELSAGVSSRA